MQVTQTRYTNIHNTVTTNLITYRSFQNSKSAATSPKLKAEVKEQTNFTIYITLGLLGLVVPKPCPITI